MFYMHRNFPMLFCVLKEGQSKNIPLENDFGSYLESRFVHLYRRLSWSVVKWLFEDCYIS